MHVTLILSVLLNMCVLHSISGPHPSVAAKVACRSWALPAPVIWDMGAYLGRPAPPSGRLIVEGLSLCQMFTEMNLYMQCNLCLLLD
jgi:hypothetical protein